MDEAQREERISGQRVYDGTIVKLDVDRVRRPDGGETVREVVRHQGAAVMLPVLDDGSVLLVRQYRYAADAWLLELPAGKIDPGERPEKTARRELEEETGWRPEVMEALGTFFTTPGFTDERLYAYRATELRQVDRTPGDEDEDIELVRMSWAELLEAVRDGRLQDAKSLATLTLAAAQGSAPGIGPV